jgi:hypothetical protein
MKQINFSVLALVSSLALVANSQAAFISDTFESYSPYGSDMDGKGGWVVLNGADSGDGPVAILDSYTWDGSAKSATLGGVAQPTVGTTSMTHSALVSLAWTNTFSIQTAYTESTAGFRNDFQISLNSTAGTLLTIDLTPGDAGEYDLSYSGLLGGGSLGSKAANVSTQFQLNTWFDGTNVNYAFSNAGAPVSSGILTAASTDDITGVAIRWYGNSNGGLGNNSITVDNVTLVPEPSSALLGLLGASCVFLRRRRA